MFKRLRERISEEASKSVAQLGNNAAKPTSETESKAVSEDLITLSESSAVVVPHTSAQQFSIGEDDDGSMSEQSTPQRNVDVTNGSVSGGKDHTPAGDTSFSQEYRPKRLSYVPQSDIESEREDPPTLNLEGISKEQLLSVIDLLKARTYKYKNKYSEVVNNFKELRDEKTKIEKTLIDTQDKGSRRIAELREQCQLEQKAKAHLEANLRLMLEEKDNRISVLETQINLLKDTNKTDDSSGLQENVQQTLEGSNGDLLTGDIVLLPGQEKSALHEKLERLDHQYNQAKKTITAQTEQIALLRKQNENLSQELEEKVKRVNELEDQQVVIKAEHEVILNSMQIRLEELEKQQEESAMSMAETKRNMHEELELKEKQLVKAKKESIELEKQKLADLQKQYEDKLSELQRQLESTEKTLEDEKQNLMQELARGKTAAIALMQKDCAKKISAVEEEWKAKLLEFQSQKSQGEEEKKGFLEIQDKLNLAETQVQELNSLVKQLENENGSLRSASEKLKTECDNRNAENEKLQTNHADLEYLRKQECLNYENKINELSIQLKNSYDQVRTLELKEKQYIDCSSLLKDELNEKNLVISGHEKQECEFNFKTNELENEIKMLNSKLKEFQLKENSKLKEIHQLQECIKQLQSKENIANENLLMCKKELQELRREKQELVLSNASLNSEVMELQSLLQQSEENRHKLETIIHQAEIEIQDLSATFDGKLEYFLQLEKDISTIENGIALFEKEHSDFRKVITSFELAFEKLIKNYNDFQIHSHNDSKCCNTTLNLSQSKFDCLEDTVIFEELGNQSVTCDSTSTDFSKFSELKSVKESQKSVENKTDSEKQSLLEDLVKENSDLRKELHHIKELSDCHNSECTKNTAELQKALDNLCEERNNLSLVLQSIDTQFNEMNSSTFLKPTSRQKPEIYVDVAEDKNKLNIPEVNFLELNSKVRSEIEALSSQTELINRELKILREQFNASQIAFSENVAHLNSKLLSRTELLLRVKEELDDVLETSESLKKMLEDKDKQLNESKEAFLCNEKEKKELENKLKLIKDKYIKKELELKQAHNVQLCDLKNQTKDTIDRLNKELAKATTVLDKKEEEFSLKLKSVKDDYNCEINKLAKSFNGVSLFQNICENLSATESDFENRISDKLLLFDLYFPKIECMQSKLTKIKSKLEQKDLLINELMMQVNSVNKQILDIKEYETGLRKLKEDEISTLKEKYEAVVKNSETFHIIENEKRLLESCLAEKQSELEKEVNKNAALSSALNSSETNIQDSSSQVHKLKEDCASLENKLAILSGVVSEKDKLIASLESKNVLTEKELSHLTSSVFEKDKFVAHLENKNASELKESYDAILGFSNMFALKSETCLNNITTSISLTEEKLKAFEIQIPKYIEKVKSLEESVFLYQSYINSWSQEIEKCLNFLQLGSVELPSEITQDRYSCNNFNTLIYFLEKKIDSFNKEYIKSYNVHAETVNKLKEIERDLYEKNSLLSSMISYEEFEKCELKYRDDMQELNNKFNSEIKDLKSTISKLEKDVTTRVIEIEKKEAIIMELQSFNSQIALMVPISDLDVCKKREEEVTDFNNKLTTEIKDLKNEIATLLASVKERDIIIKELENKTNQMTSMISVSELEKCREKCQEEIAEVTSKSNSERQNLVDIISKLEEEIASHVCALSVKEDLIKDLEVKVSQVSLMISGEDFEKFKLVKEDEIEALNHKYKTEILGLKTNINKLEGDVANYITELEKKSDAVHNCEMKVSQLSSNIPEEEFENYKRNTTVMLDELKETHSGEIQALKAETERLHSEIVRLRSTNTEKDTAIQELFNISLQLNSIICVDKYEESGDMLKDLNVILLNMKKKVSQFLKTIEDKEIQIQQILIEQGNAKVQSEENIKCLKEKYENAEKNYATQLEEMKEKIVTLEKQKQNLEEETVSLKKVKEELSEKKSKLKSQGDELKKEHLEKVQKMQEKMRDQENMVLKLETELESLAKESSEKLETLKKKIKILEQEREQLMQHAQERVSATEAKCREDTKLLQEEINKLISENKEIDQLKSKVNLLEQQLQENLKTVESSKSESSEKLSQLKEQLSETEEKLHKMEVEKQDTIGELSEQLQKIKEENSLLMNKATHLETLKSEKEALNEKLKQAELQVSSIKKLESERDTLKQENASLVEQLHSLKSSHSNSESLASENESLEATVKDFNITKQKLEQENEKLRTDLNSLKESLNSEVSSLKNRNEFLTKQIDLLEKLDPSDPSSLSVKNYIASVRLECENALKAKEDDTTTKLKLLVRDFAEQMDLKDRDCDKITGEIIERNQDLEERLEREYKNQIAELRQNLFERECAYDDMREDYEEKLQEKEKKMREYESVMKNVSHPGSGASTDSALLTAESSDWDDTWAVPEETLEPATSPNHRNCEDHLNEIETLKEDLSKCHSEIKELKVLLRLSPPDSMLNNNRRDSLQSIPEPTEFEYLKNIIYEYMMGKEPITLVKVIAAVLRFNETQTQQVIRKEESRHQMANPWLSSQLWQPNS
ncbi:golgin subfamily A member 4 isoform X2 [Parasteatoda tepidariorum]|uniref:golgin subfamily A member 4 isoform X2 n=1 Tax=Parasteatoda tepidariorum TaxID=114398 RepID=UPI001C728E38|nr:golgin subfamily A member 4 isoform X2 [Parasteatoda tepidariorum]